MGFFAVCRLPVVGRGVKWRGRGREGELSTRLVILLAFIFAMRDSSAAGGNADHLEATQQPRPVGLISGGAAGRTRLGSGFPRVDLALVNE
jgi:hypothetical protein